MPAPMTAAANTGSVRALFRLNDTQLRTLMQMVQPLRPPDRIAFLRALAGRLSGCADVGDGALYRIATETLRSYFRPPAVDTEEVPLIIDGR
jgi:hypothetical protein